MLYDCEAHYYISCKNMKLKFYSERCETQGEYIIFDYDYASLKLDGARILERCAEYD